MTYNVPINLCIRIAQLNSDIPLQLILEAHRLHARDGLDDRGLAVGHVANSSDVDCRLALDDDLREGIEGFGVFHENVLR